MLVIERKVGESILIGDNIRIVLSDINGGKAKIAIDAPREIKILRNELVETSEFNKNASVASIKDMKELNEKFKK